MVALLLVGRDHPLGDVIDVPEASIQQMVDDGDHGGWVTYLLADLVEAPGEEPSMPHPVGAHERVHRYLTLGEPASVLHGGGRYLECLRVEIMLQDVQQRGDIGLHAGREQPVHGFVAAKLWDVVDHIAPYVLADLEEVHLDGRRHGRQLALNHGTDEVHHKIVRRTDPAGSTTVDVGGHGDVGSPSGVRSRPEPF